MRKRKPIEEEFEMPTEKGMNLIDVIAADPMGSYTGRPIQQWEAPVQDADDL